MKKIRFPKFLISLTLAGTLLLSGCGLLFNDIAPSPPPPEEVVTPETPKPSTEVPVVVPVEEPVVEVDNSIRIAAVGDIMVHNPQWVAQRTGTNTFDFTNNFQFVKPVLESADLSIANLETTILPGRKISSFPMFNSPPEILDALKDAGFDVLTTINNHALDTGKAGVLSTLDQVESRGFRAVGTYRDKSQPKYLVETVKDIRLGITAFSYGSFSATDAFLNGIPSQGISSQLNIMDSSSTTKAFNKIKIQLDKMKADNCEFLIVFLHWGTEYGRKPSAYQKELAQKLIDEGVDLILGSHPHLVQTMEFMASTSGDHEGLVVYSMGNFLSNQRMEILNIEGTENGLISLVTLEKDEAGEVIIKAVEYIPTWINHYKHADNVRYVYEIVPISKDYQATALNYKASEIDVMKSLQWVQEIITDDRIHIHDETE